jgi:hypothetical protein
MRRKASVSIILTIFLLTTITPSLAQTNTDTATIHQKAVEYLLNGYNSSSLHLIPETNESDTYWLVSDNLLAYYALRNDNPAVSNEIAKTLKTYVTTYNLPCDSNGLPISYKHEPVVGDILPGKLRNPPDPPYYNVSVTSDYRVIAEIDNVTVAKGWENYADWLALEGISLFNNHQYTEANAIYNQLVNSSMWNGYGFTDDAFKNRVENQSVIKYDTYKLGLALILAKDLQIENTTFTNQCLSIIEQCQLADGGVQTYYNFTRDGQFERLPDSANTETTSITAIATETSIPPSVTPEFPELITIAMFLLTFTVGIIFYKLKGARGSDCRLFLLVGFK